MTNSMPWSCCKIERWWEDREHSLRRQEVRQQGPQDVSEHDRVRQVVRQHAHRQQEVAIQAVAVVNVTVTIPGKGICATLITPMGVELAVCGVAAKVDTGTVLIRVAIQ